MDKAQSRGELNIGRKKVVELLNEEDLARENRPIIGYTVTVR
jgi:hypothetical protein